MNEQKISVRQLVTSEWVGGYAFNTQIDGFSVRTDSKDLSESQSGAGPKKLLLASLIGCSGIDVVDILNKMRVEFDSINIEAEAEMTDGVPKIYAAIRLIYYIKGKDLSRDKVKRAVDLSLNKYCGVAAMLRKHCPISYEIIYKDQ